MGWYILTDIFTIFLTSFRLNFRSDPEKDQEILILRQQLNILQRKHDTSIKPYPFNKMILSILAARLRLISGQSITRLRRIIRIFQVETVLRWHRDLV
jgi:hypothetical protein